MLRHDGEPRPWIVCVNGYRTGEPLVDLATFRAGHLHRHLGLNVAILVQPLHGPRSAGGSSGDRVLYGGAMNLVHTAAQAAWDTRRLLSWVRGAQQAPAAGLQGISLGGLVTGLVACLDGDLACAIAGIPESDIVRGLRRTVEPLLPPFYEQWGLSWTPSERVARVATPLTMEPLVPRETAASSTPAWPTAGSGPATSWRCGSTGTDRASAGTRARTSPSRPSRRSGASSTPPSRGRSGLARRPERRYRGPPRRRPRGATARSERRGRTDRGGPPGRSPEDREVLTWSDFGMGIRELALQVADSGYQPDVILAIARGGLIPAGALGYALSVKNIYVVNVEYYTAVDERLEVPVFLPPHLDLMGVEDQQFLVVDDVADTGHTLRIVLDVCRDKVAEVRSAVVYEKPQSVVRCDYVWRRTDRWINFPWSSQQPVTGPKAGVTIAPEL